MKQLALNDSIAIRVQADKLFGGDTVLSVNEGEEYDFEVAQSEHWTDWRKKTDADGFWNPFLIFSTKRIEGVRCFTLCGTIGKNEFNHFSIGSERRNFPVPTSGDLYFFPNDSIKHYGNNKGSIVVKVTRVK